MNIEQFEARVVELAEALRRDEPGATIIIFAVPSALKAPHANPMAVVKSDDNLGVLGLIEIGSFMVREGIMRDLGLERV